MDIQEAIQIAKEKEYFPYVVYENGIYQYKETKSDQGTKNTDLIPIAERVEVAAVEINIDTDTVQLELVYYYHGENLSIKVKRSMLSKRNLPYLMEYGIDVKDSNAEILFDFLLLQEKSAPRRYVHESLGYDEYKGTKIFKLQKALRPQLAKGWDSTYIGNYDMCLKGTFDAWEDCIKKEVVGNTPMELALAIGFSAPIVSMLRDRLTPESLLVHFVGDSSKGKTTAEMLAVSPFGSPSKEDGLLRSWLATHKAEYTEVSVLTRYLNKMLKDNGFADEKIVCGSWKKAGCLIADEGHNTKKRTVSNRLTDVRCYVLRVPKPKAEEDVPTQAPEAEDGNISF